MHTLISEEKNMPIKLGQTYGHVKQTAFSNRVYHKPSLRKPVIRHPGVMRRSSAVLDRNKKVEASPPAPKCKGKAWDDFIACLSDEMKKL
jgi:hypothetical protein